MSHSDPMTIIGGGVIGLSIAYDLAQHGCSVQLFDAAEPGQEASWAGAGILSPSTRVKANHPYDELRAISWETHPRLASQLHEQTGIDNGFRTCGGIVVARSSGEAAMLLGYLQMLEDEGIAAHEVSPIELKELEPKLDEQPIQRAVVLPEEAQLRNPRHVKALTAGCEALGVTVNSHCSVSEVHTNSDSITSMTLADGRTVQTPGPVCIASGAWSQAILQRIGVTTGILPIRGQMVLFKSEQPLITHIVSEGPRYLVARDDGRLLAGSTEDEVGFVKGNTDEAVSELKQFAYSLVPGLRDVEIERTWSGLRPASFDGFPYMGRLSGLDNGFVAAGHFRSGLFLSAGTAIVMSQAMRSVPVDIDLSPFQVNRA